MSQPDDMLERVAEAARELDPLADPRWEALAAGTISEADRADLHAMADRSDAARRAWDMLQPRSAQQQRELAETVVGRAAAARRRWWPPAVAATALAAGVAFMLVHRPPPQQQPATRAAAIPPYAMAVTGGTVVLMAHEGTCQQLDPGGRCEVMLRPAKDAGKVDVKAALSDGTSVRPWSPPFEIAPSGAVRIRLVKDEAFAGVPAGRWEMIFAVGRPEALPATPEALAKAAAAPDDSGPPTFRVFRAEVVLHD
jgi:hypothetical protein